MMTLFGVLPALEVACPGALRAACQESREAPLRDLGDARGLSFSDAASDSLRRLDFVRTCPGVTGPSRDNSLRVSNSGGSVEADGAIAPPRVTHAMQTTVSAPDGDTRGIGGLVSDSAQRARVGLARGRALGPAPEPQGPSSSPTPHR